MSSFLAFRPVTGIVCHETEPRWSNTGRSLLSGINNICSNGNVGAPLGNGKLLLYLTSNGVYFVREVKVRAACVHG